MQIFLDETVFYPEKWQEKWSSMIAFNLNESSLFHLPYKA